MTAQIISMLATMQIQTDRLAGALQSDPEAHAAMLETMAKTATISDGRAIGDCLRAMQPADYHRFVKFMVGILAGLEHPFFNEAENTSAVELVEKLLNAYDVWLYNCNA